MAHRDNCDGIYGVVLSIHTPSNTGWLRSIVFDGHYGYDDSQIYISRNAGENSWSQAVGCIWIAVGITFIGLCGGRFRYFCRPSSEWSYWNSAIVGVTLLLASYVLSPTLYGVGDSVSMTPEQKRIQNYLMGQGSKYSFDELWPRAVSARLQMIDEIQGLTQEQADFSFDKDEWSIAEVLHHVIASTARVTEVVELLANGKIPDTEGVEPPREPADVGINILIEKITEGAINWAVMTSRLPKGSDKSLTSSHSFFGELNSGAWYMFQRVHDLDHVGQITACKQHPEYPDGV